MDAELVDKGDVSTLLVWLDDDVEDSEVVELP